MPDCNFQLQIKQVVYEAHEQGENYGQASQKKAEERRVRSRRCSEAGSDRAAIDPPELGLQRVFPSAPCDLSGVPLSEDPIALAV
ncbi:hypothetical protein HPB52_010495 [Rhipicephalus sanguineus]|uniref:Uncharacterized protein n=1 Tax=Rhipicephalus sanguineus TaxID=34632 RepID=A0A9D4PVR6_RHISA|nr:hypothetical protein HPB52_010495 [Rhipicephalus sanguineus]